MRSFVLAFLLVFLSQNAAPLRVQIQNKCQEEVSKHLTKWQDSLRLGNWKIISTCDMPQDKLVTHYGLSSFNTDKLEATIYINPRYPILYEHIVVHELLHLMMDNVIHARSDLVTEQAVRVLTEVIYENRRDSKEKKP